MKTAVIIGLVTACVSANASNLKCVGDELTLVLQKNSSRKVPYNARASYKAGYGFYDAECSVLSKIDNITRLECAIQYEWQFFETVAIIELAANKKSVAFTQAISDRRYNSGYRLDKKIDLKCVPTEENASGN